MPIDKKQLKRVHNFRKDRDAAVFNEVFSIADAQGEQTELLKTIAGKDIKIPAQKDIKIPDTVTVKNLPDVQKVEVTNTPKQEKTDTSKIEKLLKAILDKKGAKPQEQTDYTPILSDIADLLEAERPTNEAEILDTLKAILDKETPEVELLPRDKDGRIKVAVDKIYGGSGGGQVGMRDRSGEVVNPATEEKQDNLIANQTNGTQTTSILDIHGDPISAQHPMPTDGDSIYDKDVKDSLSNVGTFTGADLTTLFNNLDDVITDSSATNPKYFEFFLERPVFASSFGINTQTGDFSNVKVIFKNRQGTAIYTLDDSANNTKYENKSYPFPPKNFCCVRVEFHTADTVNLSGIVVQKENRHVARIQALKPDGTVTDVDATAAGNLKVAIEEMELAAQTPFLLRVAKSEIAGHSTVEKFGQNDDLNTSTYEDIWDGGGTYSYPADGTAPITEIVSTSASDTNDAEIQGLDINGDLVVQTPTLTGITPVTLTTALWRVFRVKNVNAADWVGEVTVENTANTVVYAKVQIGNNQTLMALYTIPNGKTGYLYEGTANMSEVTRSVSASGRFLTRPFGGVFQLKSTFGVGSDGGSFVKPYKLPMMIPAKTDLRVEALGSANGAAMNATFEILLIDD